jgi:HK97 family phage portal protein
MFLSPFMASGDGGDRSPWGNFWFEPTGYSSLAGVRVNADTACQFTAVFACVRVLSEGFASLPFCLYEQQGRDKAPQPKHWLAKLFCKRPNRYQTPYEWREMLQGHLALRGNAYCHLLTDWRGNITELMPLHPDRINIEIKPDGDYFYRHTARDGTVKTFARGEIWHIKGLSPDIYQGYNPIALARDAVGIGLSAQSHGAKFFANDARPSGGWIEFPGQFKDKEQKDSFRESWQQGQSGSNRGKTAILDMGMKYHELGLNMVDAQFLETRKFQVEEIARLFRVPPHMIASLERSTNNNIEHQGLEFATHTMTPWAERWESSIETHLIPDEDLEVEFDFANLYRGDAKSRAVFYQSGITAGWLTRNEAREAENRNPLAGLDEPLMPLNMAPESEAKDDEEPADGAENNETEQEK